MLNTASIDKLSLEDGSFYRMTGVKVDGSMTIEDIVSFVEKATNKKIKSGIVSGDIVPMRGNIFEFFSYNRDDLRKKIISTASKISKICV